MASQFWPRGANLKMEACAFVYSFTDPNEHLWHAVCEKHLAGSWIE